MPLTEKQIIRRIRRLAARPRGAKFPGGVGIGDDCAIVPIPNGHDTLITTDLSLENVHFKLEWHPPESVGHRCLARGLSDIAAMGGQPLAAFLSLALPQSLPQKWTDGFLRGLLKVADDFKVILAGGDTAQSPGGVIADIMILGAAPKKRVVLRSGARPGDRIYVTGLLGASAATLDLLSAGKKLRPKDFASHFYPVPRIAAGRLIREKGLASTMIDISDGLSTDLNHICEESGVGAEIEIAAIPVATIQNPPSSVELRFALHGGEDYELLFTSPPGKKVPSRIAGVSITDIGVVTRGQKVLLLDRQGKRQEFPPQGWEHFKKK